MTYTLFNSSHLPHDDLPVFSRLKEVVERHGDLDTILRGMVYARQPLYQLVGNEIPLLLDDRKAFQEVAEVLPVFGEVEETKFGKYFFFANHAYALQKMKDFKNAQVAFEHVEQFLSGDEEWVPANLSWLLNQTAWNLYELGDYESGRPLAERAVELNPENWAAIGTLGSLLYELGDDAAFEKFAVAMAHGIDPEPPPKLAADPRYIELAKTHNIKLPGEA